MNTFLPLDASIMIFLVEISDLKRFVYWERKIPCPLVHDATTARGLHAQATYLFQSLDFL